MKQRGVWILAVVLLVGCGPKAPDTVPVRGRVTYGGGAWPNPGMLYFAVKEQGVGQPMRPSVAPMAPDGSFSVTSFNQNDGLVPGKYVVTIECWKTPPTMSGGRGMSAVPVKFQNQATSDFIIDVDPSQSTIEVEFDVPKVP